MLRFFLILFVLFIAPLIGWLLYNRWESIVPRDEWGEPIPIIPLFVIGIILSTFVAIALYLWAGQRLYLEF